MEGLGDEAPSPSSTALTDLSQVPQPESVNASDLSAEPQTSAATKDTLHDPDHSDTSEVDGDIQPTSETDELLATVSAVNVASQPAGPPPPAQPSVVEPSRAGSEPQPPDADAAMTSRPHSASRSSVFETPGAAISVAPDASSHPPPERPVHAPAYVGPADPKVLTILELNAELLGYVILSCQLYIFILITTS
jgi:hypothetical protein